MTELLFELKQFKTPIQCVRVIANLGLIYDITTDSATVEEKTFILPTGFTKQELIRFLKNIPTMYASVSHESELDIVIWFVDGTWLTLKHNHDGGYSYWYHHSRPKPV